jgi:CMP-N,N'-diacetyllegionaminic acid synthase
MRFLAVIPARGGSKAIPQKNVIKLLGRPLLEYSIEQALRVDRLSKVVVSTDDENISEIAKKAGALVPFIRPLELATDEAQSAPVIKHALEFMEKQTQYEFGAVLMLQPTTPLRKAEHINKAIDMFLDNQEECDSVVSIVSVVGNHPFRMKRMIGNRLVSFIDQGFWDMRPRQSLPPVYIRNGAIYLNKREVILDQNCLIGSHCIGYEMSQEDSVNIDTPIDLLVAEKLLEKQVHDKNAVS